MHVDVQSWEDRFIRFWKQQVNISHDASHDLSHFQRVWKIARQIASVEKNISIDMPALLAAAYFHDLISLPKNHPERHLSSKLSADKAVQILQDMGFDPKSLPNVYHAIHAHSFSAQVEPTTIEAKILQDADRMEALGALGVVRLFYTAGKIGSKILHSEDPFALQRAYDDTRYALDHFFVKLFPLANTLQLEVSKSVALERVHFLHQFVDVLKEELESNIQQGALFIAMTWFNAGAQSISLLWSQCDPFALRRPLQEELYPLDIIIKKKAIQPYTLTFIEGLKDSLL